VVLFHQPMRLLDVLVGSDGGEFVGGYVVHRQGVRTGSDPFSSWIICLAASTMLAEASMVTMSETITSLTLGMLCTPFPKVACCIDGSLPRSALPKTPSRTASEKAWPLRRWMNERHPEYGRDPADPVLRLAWC
jgi:hypothetical protein